VDPDVLPASFVFVPRAAVAAEEDDRGCWTVERRVDEEAVVDEGSDAWEFEALKKWNSGQKERGKERRRKERKKERKKGKKGKRRKKERFITIQCR